MRSINKKTIYFIILPVLISIFLSAGFSVLAKSTNPVPARVTTYGSRDETPTSIDLRGYISNHGGCPDIYTWFEWGENIFYGNETNPEYRNGIGYFSDTINELEPCKTYHFRAVARNNTLEESYGSDKTFKTQCASFDVDILVKNISRGDDVWYVSRTADTGDNLMFRVKAISTGNSLVKNAIVSVQLPSAIIYKNELLVDNEENFLNIAVGGVGLGNLFPNQEKIITFEAKVGDSAALALGKNNLTTTALLYNSQSSATDTVRVVVNKGGVAGASTVAGATQVSTGVAGSILTSILLPLFISIILIWIFKSKLIGFDQWADKRKQKTIQYRAKRKLKKKMIENN